MFRLPDRFVFSFLSHLAGGVTQRLFPRAIFEPVGSLLRKKGTWREAATGDIPGISFSGMRERSVPAQRWCRRGDSPDEAPAITPSPSRRLARLTGSARSGFYNRTGRTLTWGFPTTPSSRLNPAITLINLSYRIVTAVPKLHIPQIPGGFRRFPRNMGTNEPLGSQAISHNI